MADLGVSRPGWNSAKVILINGQSALRSTSRRIHSIVRRAKLEKMTKLSASAGLQSVLNKRYKIGNASQQSYSTEQWYAYLKRF